MIVFRHLLILERTKTNAYIVVNYGGRCVTLSESNLIDYKNYLINTTPIIDSLAQARLEEQNKVKKAEDTAQVQQAKPRMNDTGKLYVEVDRKKLAEQDKKLRKEWYEDELRNSNKKAQKDKMFEAIKSSNTIQGNGGSIEVGNELKQAVLNLRTMEGNLDKLIDSRCGLTVNQKLTKCVLSLKETKIFYFGIYTAIQTLFVEDKKLMPTAGVTVDKMYINVELCSYYNMSYYI